MVASLYVHIPFCIRKCGYCDFPSVAASPLSRADYVRTVVREMELRRALLDSPVEVATVFFGGGTPSLLDPAEVALILRTADRLFLLRDDVEVTLEANPGTVSPGTLAGYRAAGVNRLSLGIQSFDDSCLRRLGRIHTSAEAVDAVRLARRAGFDNIGMDLMHTLPGQTAAHLARDLERAADLLPEHLSAYALTVEEETPFGLQQARGELELPDEDEAGDFYALVQERLTGFGYEHYEISNFARVGRRCRHNLGYWRRVSCLAFGAAAHSFVAASAGGVRWRNTKNLQGYVAAVTAGAIPERERHVLSLQEAASEAVFLALRTSEGLDLRSFAADFGGSVERFFPGIVGPLVTQGLLRSDAGRLSIPPRFLVVSNSILSRFV